MRSALVLLALTALAVAVSALPASDMPDEVTDLDAAARIGDGAVALVQEAKMAWGMDDVESPTVVHAKKGWGTMGKVGDLGESMVQAPSEEDEEDETAETNPTQGEQALQFYDLKFSVIAWKGDEENGVVAKLRLTAGELPAGPDAPTKPWYEVRIGEKGPDGARRACIFAAGSEACGTLDGKAAGLMQWPSTDGVGVDQCSADKLWSARDGDTTNFMLQLKDSRLTLYALSGTAAGGKIEITNKQVTGGAKAYHHISVATAKLGNHDATTGVWVVCGKECKRKIVTSPKGSASTVGTFVTAGTVADSYPAQTHWTGYFYPEIQRKYGKYCKAIGQGSDGNGLPGIASALQHMSCRTPWHRMMFSTLSFSSSASSEDKDASNTWSALQAIKYEAGEKLNAETDPDSIYQFHFAAQFRAAINIPETGKYIFYLYADGGNAQLTIDDGTETVPDKSYKKPDGTGDDEMLWLDKTVDVENGQRKFQVSYFQKMGASTLWVMWTSAKGIEPGGKCDSNLAQVTPQKCSMAFLSVPALIGGTVGPTDFSACGADSGALTVRAWKNIMQTTNMNDALAKTRKAPDRVFLANSVYFENTASFFSGLDSAFTNNFVLRMDGYFKARKAGKHKFWLVSDDGAQMWIDHRQFLNRDIPLTVDNDGKHPIRGIPPYPECETCVEELDLEESYYRMSIAYFDTYQVGSSQPKTSALELFVQTPADSGPRLLNCDDITHSPLSQSAKWAYDGCYYDDFCGSSTGKNRKGGTYVSIEKCYELCSGYQYFGRQGKGECWCGGKPMAQGGSEEFGKGAALLDTGNGDPKPSPENPVRPSGCACDAKEWGMCNQCVYKRLAQGVKDIAFGKTASCSKCDTDMGAWRALDGFTNHGVFTNDGKVSKATRSAACAWITGPPEGKADQPSWWRVDMKGSQRVDGFSITGTSESKFRDESIDMVAKVGDWLSQGNKDAVCAEQVSGYKGTKYYPCKTKGMQGRYFSMWTGPATSKMIICEVQVWGDEQDLAFGKHVEQISTSKTLEGCKTDNDAGCQAKRAIDGDVNVDMAGKTCTATDPSENPSPPWWKVDMKAPAAIESVTVYMPKGGIPDRTANEPIEFEVRVGDDGQDYTKNAKCGDMYMMEPGDTMKIIDCAKKVGQFVFVDIPFENKVLSLCEVRVIGSHVVEDIAKKKPCGSSSNPAACVFALDGAIGDGGDAKCSTSIAKTGEQAWWYVDMQEDFYVSKVDVWGKNSEGRLDALSNFQVRVGDNKPGGQTLDKNRACESSVNEGKIGFETFNRNPDEATPTASVPCGREPGSYVSINIPEQERAQLDLCEVKVYGQLRNRNKVNLAEGKKATQINTAYGGTASRAVDGDTETSFGKESCTHTNKAKDPWWKVDLTKVAEIHRVIVWNRSDCCAANLNNFEVRVGDNEDVFKNSVCGGKNAIDPASTAPRVVNCEKKLGRYVSIDLKDVEQYLNICEVKVQGEWADAGLQSEKGDKCAQSSTAESGYAKRAVDGNVGPEWNKNTCTMTKKEEDPYWYIDLEKEAAISKVTVWNRGDCCGERLRGFEVRVGDNDPSGGKYASNPQCGTTHWMDAPDTGGGEHSVDCDEKTGRYVTIVLPGKDRVLTLCEVRINGAHTTKALGKCRGAVATMEADMQKIKEELEIEKKKVKAAKDSSNAPAEENAEAGIDSVEEDVDKATADTGAAAGVNMDEYVKKEKHDAEMKELQAQRDSALEKVTNAEGEREAHEKDAKAKAAKLGQCTAKSQADASKYEALEAKAKDHEAGAQKCMKEASDALKDHAAAMAAQGAKLATEKKAHAQTKSSSEKAQKDMKSKCLLDEQQARDQGKQEGLKACPGVNGLMREIWRLRQKLGAADAGGE